MEKASGEEIVEFLNSKWKGKECPLCGENRWSVTDTVFELREYNGGALRPGPIIPVIPVTCANCGNTVLISAISTGLLEDKDQ